MPDDAISEPLARIAATATPAHVSPLSGSPASSPKADGRLSSVMVFSNDVEQILSSQTATSRLSITGGTARQPSNAWLGRGGNLPSRSTAATATRATAATVGGGGGIAPALPPFRVPTGRPVSPPTTSSAQPVGSAPAAVGSSSMTPQLQPIPLTHLTVETTIALRDVFDRFTSVEGTGIVSSNGLYYSDSVQTTVSRGLDLFSVTSLLHHSRVFHALPPETELRRIILRVAVANAQYVVKTDASDVEGVGQGSSSTPPANAGVGAKTSFLTSQGISYGSYGTATAAHLVHYQTEGVLEFPSTLSFSVFLQIVELVKRWQLRGEDEDEASKTFQFLHRNRKCIRAVDEAAIRNILGGRLPGQVGPVAGVLSAQSGSLTPQQGNITPAGAATLDLDQPLDLSMSRGQSPQGPATASGAPLQQGNGAGGGLNVKLLKDMLAGVGASYDFQTLFKSVDPTFDDHKGSRIDLRQFRWIAGEDDPDIVRAFVALGGDEGLSGTITVDKLIAKCEAMQMTPQYIANFVALVDANQDGVVDFTEFLALLVRNRQELTGERRAKLTDRSGAAASAFRFSSRGGPGNPTPSSNGALPFPRYKRFSRTEPGDPRRTSLPFQGSRSAADDDDDDENDEGHRGDAGGSESFAFQKKVQLLFEAPDIITIDEDESLRGAAGVTTGGGPGDGDEGGPAGATSEAAALDDSLSSDDLDATKRRQHRKRLSVQETHLGIGLSGMLQNTNTAKSERGRDKHAAPSITERIAAVVRRGQDTIAAHRGKVRAVMQDLEKRQRKLIRTEDGLVEGNRDVGESAVQQRARLRKTREEQAAHRKAVVPVSTRITALSQRALTALETDVRTMIDAKITPATRQPPPCAAPKRLEEQHGVQLQSEGEGAAAAAAAGRVEPARIMTDIPPPDAVVLRQMARPPTKQVTDVGSRLSCPHRTHRSQRAVDQTPCSAPFEVGAVVPVQVEPTQSTTPRDAALPEKRTPSGSRPPSSIKLEDPQSLWNLLEANHRRMARQRDVVEGGDVPSGPDTVASTQARRMFGRTIASHLSLRLAYDDHMSSLRTTAAGSPSAVCTAPTAASVAHAYVLGAPQPRRPLSVARRPGSSTVFARGAGTEGQSQRDASTKCVTPSMPVAPQRPQTAPSRRPLSARSAIREQQLTRATNVSPTVPPLGLPPKVAVASSALSRPSSALAPPGGSGAPRSNNALEKQFGVGGVLDVEDDDDDDAYVEVL